MAQTSRSALAVSCGGCSHCGASVIFERRSAKPVGQVLCPTCCWTAQSIERKSTALALTLLAKRINGSATKIGTRSEKKTRRELAHVIEELGALTRRLSEDQGVPAKGSDAHS